MTASVNAWRSAPTASGPHRRAWTTRRRLWDAATGPIGHPTTHGDTVDVVAFSPDGKIASRKSDNTARLWDTATGQPSAHAHGAQRWVNDVAFSPDGKLSSRESGQHGAGSGTPRRPESPIGQAVHTRIGQYRGVQPRRQAHRLGSGDETVSSGTWRPARRSLAAQGAQGEVDQRGVQPRRQAHRHGAADSTVKLWDAAPGKESAHAQGAHRGLVAFSPDGKRSPPGATTRQPAVGRGDQPEKATLDGHKGWIRGVQPGRQADRFGEQGLDGQALGRRIRLIRCLPSGLAIGQAKCGSTPTPPQTGRTKRWCGGGVAVSAPRQGVAASAGLGRVSPGAFFSSSCLHVVREATRRPAAPRRQCPAPTRERRRAIQDRRESAFWYTERVGSGRTGGRPDDVCSGFFGQPFRGPTGR